jgi:hypothetical protein
MLQRLHGVRMLAAIGMALVAGAAHPQTDAGADSEQIEQLEDALIVLAADRLESVLGAVADSVSALGDTYAGLVAAAPDVDAAARSRWAESGTTKGRTTGFRTWPESFNAPPGFQAPYPGFYSFNGDLVSDAIVARLITFEQLVPTFRSAFESFPFSWVYITTADELMMIYPYVPLDAAVNDGTPTETVYYKAADFEQRRVGWTPPYLDLVGAGMMVTASYPVLRGDEQLGVMSRDITLSQLAASTLDHLADLKDSTALIVTADGLAIAASDPALAAEIDSVNTKAKAAVLHLRTTQGLQQLQIEDAVASTNADINTVVEHILSASHEAPNSPVRARNGKRIALAAPIEETGWLVVLVRSGAENPHD